MWSKGVPSTLATPPYLPFSIGGAADGKLTESLIYYTWYICLYLNLGLNGRQRNKTWLCFVNKTSRRSCFPFQSIWFIRSRLIALPQRNTADYDRLCPFQLLTKPNHPHSEKRSNTANFRHNKQNGWQVETHYTVITVIISLELNQEV